MSNDTIEGYTCSEETMRLRDEIARLRAENEALREALERYGDHAEECVGQPAYDIPCDCGFSIALAAGRE